MKVYMVNLRRSGIFKVNFKKTFYTNNVKNVVKELYDQFHDHNSALFYHRCKQVMTLNTTDNNLFGEGNYYFSISVRCVDMSEEDYKMIPKGLRR